jgi:hypothetical protein
VRKLSIEAGAVVVLPEDELETVRDLDVEDEAVVVAFPRSWRPEDVALVVAAAVRGDLEESP